MRTDYVVMMRRFPVARDEVIAVCGDISEAGKYIADSAMAQCAADNTGSPHTYYIVKVETQ